MHSTQNYTPSKEIIINTKVSDFPSFSLASPKSFSQTQKPISNDFNALSNDISRWEAPLAEARDFGVKWEFSNYNPIELDQAIDDHNLKNWQKYKSLSTDNCK